MNKIRLVVEIECEDTSEEAAQSTARLVRSLLGEYLADDIKVTTIL